MLIGDIALHLDTWQHPVEAEDAVAFLQSHGNQLCLPTPSKCHPNHYLMFHECYFGRKLEQQLVAPDAHLPSGTYGKCEFGCNGVSLSALDKNRHKQLVHPNKFNANQAQRWNEKCQADINQTASGTSAKKHVTAAPSSAATWLLGLGTSSPSTRRRKAIYFSSS